VIRYGLAAPPGTPRPIIDRLNKELRAALAADDLRAKLAADGAMPEPGSSEDYAAAIDADEKKWAPIVKKPSPEIRVAPMLRRNVLVPVLAALWCAVAPPAAADDYPNKPITLIVPFRPAAAST